jgi:NAD(P)-dependent dehydrogenase (short-subunit alcohol dehydrogenase family)
MAGSGGVLVTGASRGIGAAIAVELAARGTVVGCVSRSGDVPAGAADHGDRLLPYACDVTDHARVREVVEEFAGATNGLAGLVNNAGGHADCAAADVTPEAFTAMFEANCVSALVFAQAARPHLARSGGVIVGMGSFFDKSGAQGSLAYAASKAALASVNRTLAVEWGHDGISTFTIAPGYIHTDLNAEWLADPETRAKVERRIPLRRIGEAGEVGRLVAALITEHVGFLTGTTIYLDGGQGVGV